MPYYEDKSKEMFNLEDQQKEIVESIKDSISGMYVQIAVSRSDCVKLGIVAGIGSALGTGAYLGTRQLVHFTKRKLRERKERENLGED